MYTKKYLISLADICMYKPENMSAISSRELLNRLEKQTEQHIQQAISHWQNMDEAQLLAPAANGGWSIAQCLDHLNTYGHYYLPAMRHAMASHVGHAEMYRATWLGNFFTKMLDPDTGKRKSKTFGKYDPPRDLDARAVVAEFIRQEEELLGLLRAAAQKDLNKIRIATSLSRFIRMNLGDTFRFFIAHNERHVRQALRGRAEV